MLKTSVPNEIINDDLWMFRVYYDNSSLPWYELVHLCIEHSADECLTHLMSDNNFENLTDYIKTVDKAVNKGRFSAVDIVANKSGKYEESFYLEDASKEQIKNYLLFTFPHRFNADLEFYINEYLYSIEEIKGICKQKFTDLGSVAYLFEFFLRNEVNSDEVVSLVYDALLSIECLDEEITYDFVYTAKDQGITDNRFWSIIVEKSLPHVIYDLVNENKIPSIVWEQVLESTVQNMDSDLVTQDISVLAHLVTKNSTFALKLIEHPDFEAVKSNSYLTDAKLWELSIVRKIYDGRYFEALKVLVNTGAKPSSIVKLTIDDGDLNFASPLSWGEDQSHFLNDVLILLEHGVIDINGALSCITDNVVNFDFNALYEQVCTHVNKIEFAQMVENKIGVRVSSYEGMTIEQARKYSEQWDIIDCHLYHVWNSESLKYESREMLY